MVAGNSNLGRFESATHGFVYKNGAMRDLGTLGGAESFVRDINNHGVIVGTAQEADGRYVAVAWDADGRARRLMDARSNAIAINDRGWITGYGYKAGGPAEGSAFVLMTMTAK